MGSLTYLFVFVVACASAYEVSNSWYWVCPGSSLRTQKCTAGILSLQSITIFSSTKVDEITKAGQRCRQLSTTHECERRITSSDTGLSASYKYLYEWSKYSCEGRASCLPVDMPEWWNLIGETNNAASIIKNSTCPRGGTKYVSGVYYHFTCRDGEDIVTKGTPPPTTPRTRPTTPTTTPAFPVYFGVYQPELNDREKILLGVAIGLAIAILIVLLIILYCWERWRKQRKFQKLLKLLGSPQAMDDGFDELNDYGTPEAWKDMTNNPDALGEYSGVKPDEFLTIDRKTMEKSGMLFSDHVGTITTMGRANTASTMTKNGGGIKRPMVEPGTGIHQGAVDYDTAENLELERRMAAALHSQNDILDEIDEDVSRH